MRRLTLSIAAFLALSPAFVGQAVVPCDAQAQQMLAPTPADERSIVTEKIEAPVLRVPKTAPAGSFVDAVLEFKPPSGARIRLDFESTANFRREGNWTLTLTGLPGKYVTKYRLVCVTESDILVWEESVEHYLGIEPEPEPQRNLKELAGAAAPQLAELFAAHAGLLERDVKAQTISSLGKYRESLAVHLAVRGLSENAAIGEINRRIDAAVGVEDAPLAAELRAKLVDCLRKIVTELGEPAPTPVPPAPHPAATAVTYVYEQRDTPVPPAVLSALNRINRELKIRATLFDDDTRDGDGEVPDQYRVALEAAQKAGLPALVVTAGDKVLKVVKAPTTEADVMGAVQ